MNNWTYLPTKIEEENKPKKPFIIKRTNKLGTDITYYCPGCKHKVWWTDKKCHACGQEIQWDDITENIDNNELKIKIDI